MRNDTAGAWSVAVEQAVAGCLDRAGVSEPPVSALDIARALGIQIVEDRRLATRGRCTRIGSAPLVVVAAEDRPERREWTIAHELGEILFPEVAACVAQGDVAEDRLREQVANLFATRLLLPTLWFRTAWRTSGGDLFALKQMFSTASHELIAWRMLDAAPGMIVSIFDQGRLTARRGNCSAGRERLFPIETEARQTLASRRGRCDLAREGLHVTVWPVDEPGWQREILRLLALTDD
jgi:hypothetical protein